MFTLCKNSKKQGDAGLGAAIAWLSGQGYAVLLPLTDSQDYDLAYDDGRLLKRVQVRTTRYRRKNRYVVNLRVSGGNRSGRGTSKTTSQAGYDELFVLTEAGDLYLVPKDVLPENELSLGEKVEQYRVKLAF